MPFQSRPSKRSVKSRLAILAHLVSHLPRGEQLLERSSLGALAQSFDLRLPLGLSSSKNAEWKTQAAPEKS